MEIIGFLIALVMLAAVCMVPFILMGVDDIRSVVADEGVPVAEMGHVQPDVALPPAQDALVDPGLVDEPDQGDDQLDGGQDVEDKTPECHYEMTRFLGAVQYCGETIIYFIIATAGVIFTIAVIRLTKK